MPSRRTIFFNLPTKDKPRREAAEEESYASTEVRVVSEGWSGMKVEWDGAGNVLLLRAAHTNENEIQTAPD